MEMNLTLEGEWFWTFMNENSILWWRVIEAKFCTMDSRWYSKVLSRCMDKNVEKSMHR